MVPLCVNYDRDTKRKAALTGQLFSIFVIMNANGEKLYTAMRFMLQMRIYCKLFQTALLSNRVAVKPVLDLITTK